MRPHTEFQCREMVRQNCPVFDYFGFLSWISLTMFYSYTHPLVPCCFAALKNHFEEPYRSPKVVLHRPPLIWGQIQKMEYFIFVFFVLWLCQLESPQGDARRGILICTSQLDLEPEQTKCKCTSYSSFSLRSLIFGWKWLQFLLISIQKLLACPPLWSRRWDCDRRVRWEGSEGVRRRWSAVICCTTFPPVSSPALASMDLDHFDRSAFDWTHSVWPAAWWCKPYFLSQSLGSLIAGK